MSNDPLGPDSRPSEEMVRSLSNALESLHVAVRRLNKLRLELAGAATDAATAFRDAAEVSERDPAAPRELVEAAQPLREMADRIEAWAAPLYAKYPEAAALLALDVKDFLPPEDAEASGDER